MAASGHVQLFFYRGQSEALTAQATGPSLARAGWLALEPNDVADAIEEERAARLGHLGGRRRETPLQKVAVSADGHRAVHLADVVARRQDLRIRRVLWLQRTRDCSVWRDHLGRFIAQLLNAPYFQLVRK